MATDSVGSSTVGGRVERMAYGGPWRWVAWRRSERVEGKADDRTSARIAMWHFLDPLETTLSDEDARA